MITANAGPSIAPEHGAPPLEVVVVQPHGSARPTPLLFVHGAWHGAWCWERFQSFFAERGYASHAPNLRGHGKSPGRERLRWTRASQFVEDLVQVVERLPRAPVLIGHSAGGYLVQRFLESRPAAGAVLLASVSSGGALGLFARMYARHPLQALKTNLSLDPLHLIGTPAIAREAFFSPDLPPDELHRHYERMQSESYALGVDMIFRPPRPERARQVPMLVIGAGRDRVITVDEVRRTATAYGTNPEIFPDITHDMMLEKGWREVAERIARWLEERGL